VGYANLGALLMNLGLPYDSNEGRSMAGAITALMGGTASMVSAEIAAKMPPVKAASEQIENTSTSGAFPGYLVNAKSAIDVLSMHLEASQQLLGDAATNEARYLAHTAADYWKEALDEARVSGLRNAQVTVLAPTGTIGFMMDCDTTGIEPMLGVVTFKKLVGGGYMTLANTSVPMGLSRLGYNQAEIDAVVAYVEAEGTIEGAPGLRDEHLPVFDGAFVPTKGVRFIRWQGHIDMMAATQPFLSGAISKTVNLPSSATVEDIADAYVMAWRKGLKAVAIYRDGSKSGQPVSVAKVEAALTPAESVVEARPVEDFNAPPVACRHRLQDERSALTHHFKFGGHEGYLTVGMYPNGQPGEVFIRMSKEGSTISGLMESFATLLSVSLQHGVPLQVVCEKLAHTRFEPSGWTGNEKMGYAKSIMDYIGRWMQYRFLEGEQLALFTPTSPLNATTSIGSGKPAAAVAEPQFGDAPICPTCGSICRASGTCFVCESCSTSVGGCS
jgi:ribonucleoside-diphosphate reductase alpha chain